MRGRTVVFGAVMAAVHAAIVGGALFAFQGGQFPPLGTGLSAEDKATLQLQVESLASRVAGLKRQYASGPMSDRIADVEVYLDAVRRPLKYDERLYAGRDSTPDGCRRPNPGHRERARGPVDERPVAVDERERRPRLLFENRRVGTAIHPDDAGLITTARRSGSTGSTSSCTVATIPFSSSSSWRSRRPATHRSPLRAGRRSVHASAVRPLHQCQPVRWRGRRARSDRIGRESLSDRSATASSWPASRWAARRHGRIAVHYADRWVAAAPGAGFSETRVFLRGELDAAAAERRPANAVAPLRRDRLRAEHVQPARSSRTRARTTDRSRRPTRWPPRCSTRG